MRTVRLSAYLLMIAMVGCRRGVTETPAASGEVARVGDASVIASDVAYALAVEKTYGNQTITKSAALIALVNDTLEREVARLFGLSVTLKDLDAFSRRVDQNTKAPEILAGVKRVFDRDRAAYERLYLAPRIVNAKLHAWYTGNPDPHRRERAAIERAYALARSGQSLAQAARTCDLKYSVGDDADHRPTTMPAALKPYLPAASWPADDPLAAILAGLTEGKIYGNIVEDDYSYRVIRLVNRNGSQNKVESIVAAKRPFDDWFREQAATVPVRVLDPALRKEVVSKYPAVWWVEKWLAGDLTPASHDAALGN